MKTQYRCMNDECGIIMSSKIARDGISCQRCNGPVLMEPFDPDLKHVPYVRKPKKECDHKYKLLDQDIETLFADGSPISFKLFAVFYCEECLDIQHRKEHKQIN